MKNKWKHGLKKLISLVLVTVIVLGVVPLETILSRAAPTGGFEISLNWNNNDSEDELLYSSYWDEYRVIRLNVNYANKNMKDSYEKGTVAITVPGIGAAGRGSRIKASSIAADPVSSSTKEYAWSYTYNSASDTYTFTNNHRLSPESHFAGSFEILWTVESRLSKDKYEQNLQAVLRAAGGIEVYSNEVTYKQVRHEDDYKLTMQSAGRDYSGEGLDSSINPDDYWWVDYEAVSILRRQSLGVKDSRTEILLLPGAELRFAEGNWDSLSMEALPYTKTSRVTILDEIEYEVWEVDMSVHSEEETSKVLDFIVIYPKALFTEDRTVAAYTRTLGTYYDKVPELETELACQGVELVLKEYPYPTYTGEILHANKSAAGIGQGTDFAAQHSEEAYQNGYIDSKHMRSGEQEYTFKLISSVRYHNIRKGTEDIYDLELIDEKVEVETEQTYRQLADSEYEITSLTIPANNNILNQNKLPIDPCKIEIYTKTSVNGAYTLLSDSYTVEAEAQTVTLDAGTTGVKIIFLELQESISVSIPVNLKFHTDDEAMLTNGGKLINTITANCYTYHSQDALAAGAKERISTADAEDQAVEEVPESEQIEVTTTDQEEDNKENAETNEDEVDLQPNDNVMNQKAPVGTKAIEFIWHAELYILEQPNFYRNTTSLGELGEYNSSNSGLLTQVTLQTDLSYMEGEELEKFSMYTILPANTGLTNQVRDKDDLYELISAATNLGISASRIKRALTVKMEHNFQGSGRTKLTFDFDFSGSTLKAPEGFINIAFPIVVKDTGLLRYGAEVSVRGVTIVHDQANINKPSSGIAHNDGSYANTNEEALWNDLAGDGKTERELSQDTASQRKDSIAIAIEEGVTKLVATETEGGIYTIPEREKDEAENLQYVQDTIPAAELGTAYSYKLRMNPISGQGVSYATDIVFMDALETGDNTEWKGSFLDVDTSEAEVLLKAENGTEVKAEIYYSKTDYSSQMKNSNYVPNLDTLDWSKDDKTDAKTIAISFGEAQLKGNQQLTVTIQMRAPEQSDKVYELTENAAAVSYRAMAVDGVQIDQQWLPSNPVAVKLMPELVQLRIIKVDEVTEERLEGAVFDLYRWPESGQADPSQDQLVKENLTTNSKGEVLVRNVPKGDYYLHEKQPPKGYEQKSTYEKLEVYPENDSQEIETVIRNSRKSGMVTLKKVNDRDESIVIESAVFELYQKVGDNYIKVPGDLETDHNGELIVSPLEWGDYYFIETGSPPGYADPDPERKYEFIISAENDAGTELVLKIENEQLPARVKLIKYEKLENGDITQTPLTNGFYTLHSDENEELGTYMTDENGEVFLDDLTFGSYYFIESIAPRGYYLYEEKIEFELTADHVNPDYCEVITYDRRKYGSVFMQKTDDARNYVGNAGYGLYRLNQNSGEYELYKPDAAYENPRLTDEAEGTITFEELIWGEYYLQETAAPTGYQLDENKHFFTVDAGQVDAEIIQKVEDKRATGEVKIVKIQAGKDPEDVNYRLNDAIFNLYKTDGSLVKENLRTETINQGQADEEKGILLIRELEWGSYYLEEIQAPDGYGLSGEKIRFSINYLTAGVTQTIIVENPLQSKELRITKRILKDSIEFTHGVPTFTFKVTDENDKSRYKSVTFGQDYVENYQDAGDGYVEMTVIFSGLENSVYTVNEVDVIRYEFEGIDQAATLNQQGTAGPVPQVDTTNQRVVFDLNGTTSYGEARFTNSKESHESTSETAQIRNIVKSQRKLTALIAHYSGKTMADVIDRNELDVWAVYDDGYQPKLGNNDYTLLYYDGSEWKVLQDDEIPEDLLQGEYQIRISYSSGGITRTADLIIQVSQTSPFRWTVSNGEAVVYGYTGKSTVVIVPDEVAGYWDDTGEYVDDGNIYPVKGVTGNNNDSMFADERKASITRVVLPEAITMIGDYTFFECTGLTNVVDIPVSVTKIGTAAFQDCTNMSGEVKFPTGLTSIGAYAFYRCRSVSGTLDIPQGLDKIETYTFSQTTFSGPLIIPGNIISIGEGAFRSCTGFTGNLEIKSTVKNVGKEAFYMCSGFNGQLILEEGIEEVGESAFRSCTNFTGSLVIPGTIDAIANQTFQSCSNFTSLTINNGSAKIGDNAFNGCSKLSGTLTIPGSVIEIGARAFSSCRQISGLIMEEGLEEIGEYAFQNLTEIKGGLTFPSSMKKIGGRAFNATNNTNIGTITFQEGLEYIGEYAFSYIDWAQGSTYIPVSVSYIGQNAFQYTGEYGGAIFYFKANSPLRDDTNFPFGLEPGNIGSY